MPPPGSTDPPQSRAQLASKPRVGAGYWIDHAELHHSDLDWLATSERLILWNVKMPDGFLSKLPQLWWLDVRGGTSADLSFCAGTQTVEYLRVNQVRGLHDLSCIASLDRLRYLDIYGCSKVIELPSCRTLVNLERAQLGQLKGLKALGGLLDAPNLRELSLSKRVGVSDTDIETMRTHPSLERFGWDPADVPVSMRQPVVDRINLPEAPRGWALDWFADRGRGPGKGHGGG